MSIKKQLQILKRIQRDLKSLPAHDMAIGAAITCVSLAIQHLGENHKGKILKGSQ